MLGGAISGYSPGLSPVPSETWWKRLGRVAAGDLGIGIKVTSRDEIGQLASSFNYMTERLREYTGNLKRINSQLEADAATIDELRSYTENILNSITPGF